MKTTLLRPIDAKNNEGTICRSTQYPDSDYIDDAKTWQWNVQSPTALDFHLGHLKGKPSQSHKRRSVEVQTAVQDEAPSTELMRTRIVERAQLALKRSGYPVENIYCQCDDRTLSLHGYATRYFHLQMAIEALRSLSNGRRIVINVEIVPENYSACK